MRRETEAAPGGPREPGFRAAGPGRPAWVTEPHGSTDGFQGARGHCDGGSGQPAGGTPRQRRRSVTMAQAPREGNSGGARGLCWWVVCQERGDARRGASLSVTWGWAGASRVLSVAPREGFHATKRRPIDSGVFRSEAQAGAGDAETGTASVKMTLRSTDGSPSLSTPLSVKAEGNPGPWGCRVKCQRKTRQEDWERTGPGGQWCPGDPGGAPRRREASPSRMESRGQWRGQTDGLSFCLHGGRC